MSVKQRSSQTSSQKVSVTAEERMGCNGAKQEGRWPGGGLSKSARWAMEMDWTRVALAEVEKSGQTWDILKTSCHQDLVANRRGE